MRGGGAGEVEHRRAAFEGGGVVRDGDAEFADACERAGIGADSLAAGALGGGAEGHPLMGMDGRDEDAPHPAGRTDDADPHHWPDSGAS